MKRSGFLAGMLLSGAALAQVTLAQVTLRRAEDATSDTYTFTSAECNATITVRWANNGVVTQLCSALRIWATEGECAEAPGTADKRYDDVPQLTFQGVRAGAFTVKIAELPGFASTSAADGGTAQACGAPRYTKSHRLCGSIDTSFNGCVSQSKLAASGLKLVYDALPPSAPTMGEVTAQDEAVRVAFTTDSDTAFVQVEARPAGVGDYVTAGEAPATNEYVRGEGLVNGTLYEVRLRARDAAGNVSDPTAAQEVTPIRTLGFWGYFREKGGSGGQSCASAPGLSGLGLSLMLLRRMRPKRKRSEA